jgi:type 1 glutamine amidotransferase
MIPSTLRSTRRQALGWMAGAAFAQGVPKEPRARKPYVVLASGESEYKSENTLAGLAQELESKFGMRCNLLVSSGSSDLPGLEALEDAAVAVFFLRQLALPADQLHHIKAYLDSKKPLVALRTTTQGFGNWKEFGEQVLGASWRRHYGEESTTDVRVIPDQARHPILAGVAREFSCRSPLVHVLPLSGGVKPLLTGTSKGPSPEPNRVENPVAWTTSYKGGRVFYTSLGHPDDFQVEAFRKLLINGVHWAMDRIPA